MNTRDLTGIATVKRMKLENTVGKQIGRMVLIGKAGNFLIARKIRETIDYLKNPNHINNISYI